MAKNTSMRWRLPLVCLLWELAMIVLFGVFVRFSPAADAHWEEEKRELNLTSDMENDFYFRYPCEYCGSLRPAQPWVGFGVHRRPGETDGWRLCGLPRLCPQGTAARCLTPRQEWG